MKTDKELMELAIKIASLADAHKVIFGLLKELELRSIPPKPLLTGILPGEMW